MSKIELECKIEEKEKNYNDNVKDLNDKTLITKQKKINRLFAPIISKQLPEKKDEKNEKQEKEVSKLFSQKKANKDISQLVSQYANDLVKVIHEKVKMSTNVNVINSSNNNCKVFESNKKGGKSKRYKSLIKKFSVETEIKELEEIKRKEKRKFKKSLENQVKAEKINNSIMFNVVAKSLNYSINIQQKQEKNTELPHKKNDNEDLNHFFAPLVSEAIEKINSGKNSQKVSDFYNDNKDKNDVNKTTSETKLQVEIINKEKSDSDKNCTIADASIEESISDDKKIEKRTKFVKIIQDNINNNDLSESRKNADVKENNDIKEKEENENMSSINSEGDSNSKKKLFNKKKSKNVFAKYKKEKKINPDDYEIVKYIKNENKIALEKIFMKNAKILDKLTNNYEENEDDQIIFEGIKKDMLDIDYKKDYENICKTISEAMKVGVYPETNIKFYRYGKIIGRGAFGKVNIGVHVASGRVVAVKSFKLNNSEINSIKRKLHLETQLMRSINHRNVVRIYETFETEKLLMIVLEYVAGGDLLTYLKKKNKVTENTCKFIFKQLIQGLHYMHSQGIIHRDVKLDNILIDSDSTIKICDLGVSKMIKPGELMTEQCGTPAYIAPEIISGNGYYGFGADIWSAGVVFYALLSGTVPFKGSDMQELHDLIVKADYPELTDISVEANELIKGMLEVDPAKRLTTEQLLKHPYLEDYTKHIK